ncbi:hypothetical protein B0H14DRAFT_3511801 [Mycena olivaceomarginata]|nr:hypothetical protein B0H14DRAFT_3511801 [Mycena olivaceomarginata]
MAQIRRGPSGIKLLLQYLRKINWQTDDILLTVATLKLTQLLEEMQCLWCFKSGHRSIQHCIAICTDHLVQVIYDLGFLVTFETNVPEYVQKLSPVLITVG